MFSRLSGVIASCVLVFSSIALGQVTTGTILGTVHDSSGAVVAGAEITSDIVLSLLVFRLPVPL